MNKLSLKKIRIDYTRPINSRAKLDTGKLCNYKCDFCYYKKRLTERDDLEKIFERVDIIQKYGIEEIDLSGGESSVEPNWFKILEYCQNKFKRISCLSHGGKFSNIDFLRKSKQFGLTEILFSLHATDPTIHDRIVGKSGAFKNLIAAIENSHREQIEVRLNTTIYQPNYNNIDTEFIRNLRPTQINFIALNYWSDNKDFEHKIDYAEVCEYVKKYILGLKDHMEVNARYFPFCYMQGFEKYVKNHYQHIYDMKDWNKAIYNLGLDVTVPYSHEQKVDQCFSEAERLRIYSCFKTMACTGCKYFYICDGIEHQLNGHVEPRPVPGDKIDIL